MKIYIDSTKITSCTSMGIIGNNDKPIEIIQGGTTINSIPIKYKNEYTTLEEEKGMFFIFDDCIPNIDFYALPRIDIFARDNQGGYFGTVGATSDIDDLKSPICYIDKNRDIFEVANCFRDLIFSKETIEEKLKFKKPIKEIKLYNSFEEAKELYNFIDIEKQMEKMKLIKILKNMRDNYIINQVEKAKYPKFELGSLVRYHIIFSGRVQKVGFRFEMKQLALRLQLTGWIKNLENGNVEMEIQGMDNKIDFALNFMKSLKRIKINHIQKEIVPILNKEEEFKIV